MNRNIIDFALLAFLILIIYIRNDTLVSFFNSILGRFILIIFIISLSLKDTLWGLLGLLLLVVFRESYVEGLKTEINSTIESLQNMSEDNDNQIDSLIDPKDIPSNGTVTIKDIKNRTFTETVSKTLFNPPDVTPSEWRRENCSKDNKVMLNNKEVTNYIQIPDLFSNFSFVDQPCNPCDISCNFKISSARDAVTVSESIRSKPSNQTNIDQSRDGNSSQKQPLHTDGTSAGSGQITPVTPTPVVTPDSSKLPPSPVPSSEPAQIDKLVGQCDYKNNTKCIFSDFVKQGDKCVLPGSQQSYNPSELANYDTNTFVGWLKSLFNRNQIGTNDNNYEAKLVYDYVNKCKTVPGYDYLDKLNLSKPSPPAANVVTTLPDCVVSGVTVPGWKQLPNGNCVAPMGQKCCNPFTYEGQPVCQANFNNYDVNSINDWINGCIKK